MTLPLPGGPLPDHEVQAKFDEISLKWESRYVGVFSVYRNAASALATGTKITFDTKEYDPSGWFDTGAGTWPPKIAGYYRLSWVACAAQPAANSIYTLLTKNAG